jgi:glycosyltransferase involved in cell wall biosynthesis
MTDEGGLPMVSVMLTTYKQEQYIEQAIRSAAEQKTTFPIEILVGEDGSPDGTRAVCERLAAEFPDRVKLFAHEQNIGGHDNVNFIWTRARGKYIAWLEGDDYWTDPHKLQIQVEAMERTPEASFCFHNAWVFTEGNPDDPGTVRPGLQEERLFPFANLVFSNPVMTCSAMYRRGLVTELPSWVWPLKIGDWPMHLMHAVHGPALFLPRTMAAYRLHPGGGWSGQPLRYRLQNTIDALDAVGQHVPPVLAELCRLSTDGFRRDVDLDERNTDLAERSTQLHERNLAFLDLQGELDARSAQLHERNLAFLALQGELDARSAQLHERNLAFLALQDELNERSTQLHERNLAFLALEADAAALRARVAYLETPVWRRAWRKVWRPIYRRLKGA